MSELEGIPVKTVKPVCGSNPQQAILVFIDGVDLVGADGVLFFRIIQIVHHMAGVPGKAVQSSAKGSNPCVAFGVHVDGKDEVPAQRVWIFRIVAVIGKPVTLAVVFIYAAAPRSEP